MQNVVGQGRLLLLTDRMNEARALQQMLQRVQPCDVAALHQAVTKDGDHAAIVCDVSLEAPRSVEMLRAALSRHRRAPNIPVLFLLRDPSHVTQGQARLAGATATLVQPATAEQLLATMRDLIAGHAAAQPETSVVDVRGSVRNVGQALTSLFQAVATRQAIPADGLDRGGGVLLDAIKQAKIQAWLDVVWSYDDATYQHCLLVAGLAAAFALELGLPPKMQHILSQAALVHDIGKAQVPRHILNKEGRLTADEKAIMRSHPAAGHRMLAGQPGILPDLLDVTRHHHEYLDGSGYPDGLGGTRISRLVRIVTVCDIYAALVERRPYKRPMPSKAALDHLDQLGPKLDQALVKAFRNVVRDT